MITPGNSESSISNIPRPRERLDWMEGLAFFPTPLPWTETAYYGHSPWVHKVYDRVATDAHDTLSLGLRDGRMQSMRIMVEAFQNPGHWASTSEFPE